MTTIYDFVQKHGGNVNRRDYGAVKLRDGNLVRHVLPDGAFYYEDRQGVWMHDCPPGLDGLELRRQYHEAMLEPAEKDFHALKRALLDGGDAFPWDVSRYGPDPQDEVKALQTVRDVVLHHRKVLEEIEAAIEADPVMKAQRDKEREELRRREEAKRQADAYREKQRQAIREISI